MGARLQHDALLHHCGDQRCRRPLAVHPGGCSNQRDGAAGNLVRMFRRCRCATDNVDEDNSCCQYAASCKPAKACCS
jgi:hypothetical protein